MIVSSISYYSQLKLPATDSAKVILLNQREIALSQLERAALLFLHEKDFVSSVTLACAAEGIFGEYLKAQGISSHAEELKAILKTKYAPHLSLKQINDEYVNRVRNFFKHKVKDINELVQVEPETEAISALVRAAYNAALVTGSLPEAVIAFFKWLKANRPDLSSVDDLE